VWASYEGNPADVANQLIDKWNNCLEKGEAPYKKTPGLIRAIGTIIYFRRKGVEVNQIPDGNSSCDIDPICLACKNCKR